MRGASGFGGRKCQPVGPPGHDGAGTSPHGAGPQTFAALRDDLNPPGPFFFMDLAR